jgi:hypothetical protein
MKRSKDWAALRETILRWWRGRKLSIKIAAHAPISDYLAQLDKSRRRRRSVNRGSGID